MLNIYKGLPISYDANIDSVGDFEIQVRTNKQQIACLYHQGESYLQREGLPFIIRSQVISLNLAKDYAILANFEVAQDTIGKRAQIRVEPDETMMAGIQSTGSLSEIPAPVADISAGGASVYLESYMFPVRLFRPGTELTMSITLPDFISQKIKKLSRKPKLGDTKFNFSLHTGSLNEERDDKTAKITAQGKVMTVHPDFHLNRYRVGTKLYFKDSQRAVISYYISQRQSEIIQDLHILSDELYSRKK